MGSSSQATLLPWLRQASRDRCSSLRKASASAGRPAGSMTTPPNWFGANARISSSAPGGSGWIAMTPPAYPPAAALGPSSERRVRCGASLGQTPTPRPPPPIFGGGGERDHPPGSLRQGAGGQGGVWVDRPSGRGVQQKGAWSGDGEGNDIAAGYRAGVWAILGVAGAE